MPTEAIRFPGRQGRSLAARLDTPAEAPRAYALFAHCFTCSKDSKAAAYVAQKDDAQRARLLEIASKCPVHRTLHSEVWVPTTLA